ncbi:MAG: hypothetical protein IJA44_04220 [Clostridia bacterium]|nr:hypothetical protein [Clostridia bacterium]
MLNFVLFLLFGLGIFSLSLIGYKNYRSTTLYALAIGGVVNANFFHASAYPINCFGLPFGIDSIIYTLFAFCTLVMLLKENKKSAYLLAFSSIIAILFSAAMQLFADLFSQGNSKTAWMTFISFCISIVASIVAVLGTVEVVDRLKTRLNQYLCMAVGIIIIMLLNSGIYYPLSIIVNGVTDNIGELLITSFVGRLIAVLYSILMLYFMNLIEKSIANKKS